MKERPILFSAAMIQAILDGRKTQTRRKIKKTFNISDGEAIHMRDHNNKSFGWLSCKMMNEQPELARSYCPYGVIGDRLWVRETWSDEWLNYDDAYGEACVGNISYKATWEKDKEDFDEPKWKSPLFMRRDYSRITLEITNIRVEKVQSISEEDAKVEGIGGKDTITVSEFTTKTYREAFEYYWQSLFNDLSWSENCWVWVIEFKRVN